MTRPIGYAISFLGLGRVPDEYARGVARLKRLRLPVGRYVRPCEGDSRFIGLHDEQKIGVKFAEPDPAKRRNPVQDDPLAHLEFAKTLAFPDALHDQEVDPRMLEVALAAMRLGEGLDGHRQFVEDELWAVATELQGLAGTIRDGMPGHVRALCGGYNIAMMACLVEVLEWEDDQLPRLFQSGFPVAGDGSAREPGVRDSGLFRRCARAALYSMQELASGSGRAAKLGFMSNTAWLRETDRAISEQARRAEREGGDRLASLKKVDEATAEEASQPERPADSDPRSPSPVPTMGPRMTIRQLKRWAAMECGGIHNVRVARRFAIRQGTNEATGEAKYRCIDDDKQSGVNGATATLETLMLISVMFVASAARTFHTAAGRLGLPMPRLTIGLDDLRKAYRVVPNSMPWLSVVAVWAFSWNCTAFHVMYGHSFGKVASVLNFNRLPCFVCEVALVLLLILVQHYVDDYVNCDLRAGRDSAQRGLRTVHQVIGLDVEMKKRKPNAASNHVLGIGASAEHVHESMYIELYPLEERRVALEEQLAECKRSGRLTPAEASKIRGKVGFLLLPAYGRVGRAALQPLVQREWDDSPPYLWTPALEVMRLYLVELLPLVPDLYIPMAPTSEPPVVAYTDAAFHWYHDSSGRAWPIAPLGVYLFDPFDGTEWYSELVLPPYFYEFLAADKETYVTQAELIVAVALYFSLPSRLRHRRVLHYIDNTGALAALVNGYSKALDMAALVSAFHVQLMKLRTRVFFDWVPSRANISDWPTRPEKRHLIPSRAKYFELVLPPMELFNKDIVSYVRSINASDSGQARAGV